MLGLAGRHRFARLGFLVRLGVFVRVFVLAEDFRLRVVFAFFFLRVPAEADGLESRVDCLMAAWAAASRAIGTR